MKYRLPSALLAATTLACAGMARAQDTPPSGASPEVAAQIEALKAQVEALQNQVRQLSAKVGKVEKAEPGWKGAPSWTGPDGWTFKPKGVIQFDAGYVSLPRRIAGLVPVSGTSAGSGVNTNNLGWNSRARRLIFGVEGSMPAGFGYKLELELSQGGVQYEDMILSWQKPGSPWSVTLGYQYPLSSLELLTSNRFTSFMERGGATDAFNYSRRLGGTLAYADPKGLWSLAAGLYSEDVGNGNVARTGWQASVRGYASPKLGDVQTHIGFNYQHRVSPRDAQNIRYRQRPYTQVSGERFIDTGPLAADGDDILGGELALIYGPFHFASEYQHVWVRSFGANHRYGLNNMAGTTNSLAGDPQFRSGYVEIGYYLTGETRGYKSGRWDRTKVRHPVTDGGIGAFQINTRFDVTDLNDRIGGPGTTLAGNDITYVNGGASKGYEASLIWLPIDYVKLMLQYAHADISGGPSARAFSGFTTPLPSGFRHGYGVDSVTLRTQLDF
ncbi:porin [Rhizorhabdus dicambivorans]|uniref:porin n=1 Tax=Rhizorhabdus dicambivorans TaxID=1850238 RepID=UPI00111238DE|nr:porin [Rhizorhabdus dicambivorans]